MRLLWLWLLGCTEAPRGTLEVGYAGCDEIPAAWTCTVHGPRTLRLRAASRPTAAALDNTPLAPRATDLADVWELDLPARDGALTVDLEGDLRWSLAVRHAPLPPILAQAAALRAAGDDGGAVALLQAAEPSTADDPAPVWSALARALRGRGEDDRLIDLLERAIVGHQAAGRPRAAARDAGMLAFYALRRPDAEQRLRELVDGFVDRPGELYLARQRFTLRLYLAELLGDTAEGERLVTEATRYAGWSGEPLAAREASAILARLYLADGRHDDAVDLLAASAATGGPCERGMDTLLRSWALVFRERAARAVGDTTGDGWRRGEVLDLVTAGEALLAGCPRRERDADSVALVRAWGAWLDGDPVEAATRLAAAPGSDDLELQMLGLELQAALAEHAARPQEAEARWTDLIDLSRVLALQDSEARALRERARVRAPYAPALALEDLEAQARLSSRAASNVGWRQRDRYLAEWEPAAERHARLLVAAGRRRDAVEVLRAARSSYLRSLLGANDGVGGELRAARSELASLHAALRDAPTSEIPALEARRAELVRRVEDSIGPGGRSAPPPLPVDAVVLGFSTGVSGTPLRYVVADGAVEVTAQPPEADLHLPSPPPGGVVLHASGDAMRQDLHRLRVDGRELIASAPVRWSLDLAPSPPRAPTGRALVVIDPTGDLPGARREEADVTAALSGAGLDVRVLRGHEATPAAVLDALRAGVDVLHIASHARWDDRSGDGALLLAHREPLSLADVLTSPAPRVVMLAACETASTRVSRVAGLGLGQAFVVAGASVVVATARPIADPVAQAFIAAWYEVGPADPLAAFRHATLRVARDDDDGWAFRVLTP